MKYLLISILLAGSFPLFAQCDKKLILTSSKTDYLGADSSLQRSQDEQSKIEFDKASVMVTHGDETMTGTVTKYTCNWKTPFKEGKITMKVIFEDAGGDKKNVTMSIYDKEGKIIMLMELDDNADRKIMLTAEKFEEKK